MTNYGKQTVTSKLKWWRRNQFHGQVRTIWELWILNSIKLFNFSGKHTFKNIIFQEHTFSPSFYKSLVSIWTIYMLDLHAVLGMIPGKPSFWRCHILRTYFMHSFLTPVWFRSETWVRQHGRFAWPLFGIFPREYIKKNCCMLRTHL